MRLTAAAALLLIPLFCAAQTPMDPPVPTAGQIPASRSNQPKIANSDVGEVLFDYAEIVGSRLMALNVKVTVGEYILTGGMLEGDVEKELIFTGSPALVYRGQTVTGDAIRFEPKSRRYRIDNPHTRLAPDFLRGQVTSPLTVSGGRIFGDRTPPVNARNADVTTCDLERAHYLLRASELRMEPGKRVVLRNTGVYLWGRRLFTLPTLLIPLDQKGLRRTGYVPQFGQSQDEGVFVKSAFNYLLADRIPGILRLDLMQKRGVGLGFEQEYNLSRVSGTAAFYTIPFGGRGNNLTGRLNTRFLVTPSLQVSTDNELQNNSYLGLPQTSTLNNRVGLQYQAGTASTTLSIARQNSQSSGSLTRSYTANLNQTARLFGFQTQFSGDYSRYYSGFGDLINRNDQMNLRLQADRSSPNGSVQFTANRQVPVGPRTATSFFGGVEKLPELAFNNFRPTGGALARLPLTFTMSAGKYAEGSTIGGTPTRLSSERVVLGFDMTQTRISLSKSTDLNVGGGFMQYLYGGLDAAQYVLRNNTTFTQRWNRTSGVNLAYTYQRPYGGTPFRFDQQGQFHALNADIGFLDDRRLQLTARVGYDFAQTSFGGFSAPWQTLSANLLARPNESTRIQNLFTFDPNTGRFLQVTTDMRFRGRHDFAADVVARFDPSRHKFGQINSYLHIPVGRTWRVTTLLQYNGFLNRFENKSLQIVKDLHCMEASLTYMENPFGFRNDRQFYFSFRIKGIPFFDRFGTGGFGNAIDTGVGGIY